MTNHTIHTLSTRCWNAPSGPSGSRLHQVGTAFIQRICLALSHLGLLLFFLLPGLASCSALEHPSEETTSRLEHPFVDVAVDLGLNQSHTGGSPEKGYIVVLRM